MTTVTSTSTTASSTATTTKSKSTMSALNGTDFIKLMTVQLQQQDPLSPTDNSQMLAQMAQFSSLSTASETKTGIDDLNTTLKAISTKLDNVITAQTAAKAATATTSTSTTA